MNVSVNLAPIGLDKSMWFVEREPLYEPLHLKISSPKFRPSLKIPLTYLYFAMHDAIIINVLRVFNLSAGNIFTRDDVTT